jgi:anti-anti-sigma factor
MPIERWSEDVVVVHLADDPQFTDDLEALDNPSLPSPMRVVLDFSTVHFINSSNLAKLLRLRKQTILSSGRLILCNISTQVWGTFLVTGLDKVFEFSDNVPTSLATLQMA